MADSENLHRVAGVEEFEDGECHLVEADDEEIAVWQIGEEFHALDNVCTHQGGPLCDGRTEENFVYCPWHGHQFDLRTGEHGQLDRLDTRTFDVVVDGDDVFVEI